MILVYSNSITPRLEYILHEILYKRLGYSFECTDDLNKFISFDQYKINYSHHSINDSFQIEPHGLLNQTEWHELPDLTVHTDHLWHHTFFPTKDGNIPFDVFSAAFYLITRYEEYHAPEHAFDKHHRFNYTESIAFKHGFLELPIIDIWSNTLKTVMNISATPDTNRSFQFHSTIDIDFAYRYKGYGIFSQLKKIGKSLFQLRLKDLQTQIASMLGFIPDPYDTYSYIEEICQRYHAHLHYFVLMSNESKYDKNISPKHPYIKLLLKRLQEKGELGIHPSYLSGDDYKMIAHEKKHMEAILQKQVLHSRQHYLRFQIPSTFQSLIKAGITNDYSMAYAGHVGFRASTCMPFQFFDIIANQITPLTLYPVAVMDTTLRYAMKMKPADAQKKIEQLMVIVKELNGTFISIWHNSNLGEEEGWGNWKNIFEYMHTLATEK